LDRRPSLAVRPQRVVLAEDDRLESVVVDALQDGAVGGRIVIPRLSRQVGGAPFQALPAERLGLAESEAIFSACLFVCSRRAPRQGGGNNVGKKNGKRITAREFCHVPSSPLDGMPPFQGKASTVRDASYNNATIV